jgi:hypothetical protein
MSNAIYRITITVRGGSQCAPKQSIDILQPRKSLKGACALSLNVLSSFILHFHNVHRCA